MLNKVKTLLGLTGNDKDDLLNLLLDNAVEFATNYTHNKNVEELNGCIQQIVVYNYNRLGTEGVDSESYSGVSFNYATDLPPAIYSALKSHRKVMVI